MNSVIMIAALVTAVGQVERAAGEATEKQLLDRARPTAMSLG